MAQLFRGRSSNGFNLRKGIGPVIYDQPSDEYVLNRYNDLELCPATLPVNPFGQDGYVHNVQSTNLVYNSADPTLLPISGAGSFTSSITAKGRVLGNFVPASGEGEGDTTGVQIRDITDVLAGEVFSIQIVLKANGVTKVRARRTNVVQDNLNALMIDLTIGDTTGSTGTNLNVIDLGDGYYYAEWTYTTTADSTASHGYTFQADDVLEADGINGFYIGAPQLEKLPHTSAFIATYGSTVTRFVKNLYLSTKGNVPVIDNGFSLECVFTPKRLATDINQIIIGMRPLASDYAIFYLNTVGSLVFIIRINSVSYSCSSEVGLVQGAENKAIVTVENNTMKLYTNGALRQTSAYPGVVSPAIYNAELFFGNWATTALNSPYQGAIKRTRIYQYAIQEAEANLRTGGN